MSTPQTTWTVTGQAADQTQITTAGQIVTGVLVYFVTGAGNRGSVFVPDDQYNPANVQAMVAAQANQMDTIAALTESTILGQ